MSEHFYSSTACIDVPHFSQSNILTGDLHIWVLLTPLPVCSVLVRDLVSRNRRVKETHDGMERFFWYHRQLLGTEK